MIEAKTPTKKAFWAALIVVSISMTVISLSRAVDNFFGETSHIISEHVEVDDMVYPPLKVCLNHWVSWTNWSAAQEMGFTKSEVLFAMSFLDKVHSSITFDVNEVGESFFRKLTAHNMSLLEEFYKSIALRRKNVLRNLKQEEIKYEILIEKLDDDQLGTSYVLCYLYSEERIKENIRRMLLDKERPHFQGIVFFIDVGNLPAEISEKAWLSEKEAKTNGFDPVKIFANGFTQNTLVIKFMSLYINMGTVVRSWKNHTKAPCQEGRNWVEGNKTCYEACNTKFYPLTKKGKLTKKPTKMVFNHNEENGLFFDNPKNKTEVVKAEKYLLFFISSSGIDETNTFESEKKPQGSHDKCIESCKTEIGCRVWSYTTHYMYLPHYKPEDRCIMLIYPSSIEVMKEVGLQTMENFISNVGGMLGIWTGASILTFLQIIYLCCCQGGLENDDHLPTD